MKQKLKGGAEYDVLFGKHVYCYIQRPGVSSSIKRKMRRRLRQEFKTELRNELIAA